MWKNDKKYSKWPKCFFEVIIISAEWQIWQHKIVSMQQVSPRPPKKSLVFIRWMETLISKKLPGVRTLCVEFGVILGVMLFLFINSNRMLAHWWVQNSIIVSCQIWEERMISKNCLIFISLKNTTSFESLSE